MAITRCIQSLTIVADSAEPSNFLEEMSAPYIASAPALVRPARNEKGATRSPKKTERSGQHWGSRAPIHTARPKRISSSVDHNGPRQGDSIVATVGLKFRWGGYDCVVSGLNADGAEAASGASRLIIPFGERVQVAGQYRILVSRL